MVSAIAPKVNGWADVNGSIPIRNRTVCKTPGKIRVFMLPGAIAGAIPKRWVLMLS
jgi:hypothetical protein